MTAHSLTPRQKQILGLILAGKVNKEIALALHLEYQTVRNRIAEIYEALGVKNTRQLLPMADKLQREMSEQVQ